MAPTRRDFLKTIPLAGLAAPFARAADDSTEKGFTFGFISDIHHGQFGRDQLGRVKDFVAAANARKSGFILQCGDFFTHKGGLEACKPVLDAWNAFDGPTHHVIGNHDCDFLAKEDLVKAWGMPAPYYSFDAGGFHFVILDRNHYVADDGSVVPYRKANWYFISSRGGVGKDAKLGLADKAQLEWFAKDLASTELTTVVFLHQPIVVGSNEGNWDEVAMVIDRHNASKHRSQVVAVLGGHDHEEQYAVRRGVHYLNMMSSSYAIPLAHYLHYEKSRSLFTFITLDAAKREMRIEASHSSYENQEKLDPKLAWVIPPAIAARTLPFLG